MPKVPFLKDSGRCPKILDDTLNTAANERTSGQFFS